MVQPLITRAEEQDPRNENANFHTRSAVGGRMVMSDREG